MSGESLREWVVLLEADAADGSTVECVDLTRLIAAWPGATPTTLSCEHRYALQLPVHAPNAVAALSQAVTLWENALAVARLARWPLVRAEVLTPYELSRDFAEAEGTGGGLTDSEFAMERSDAGEELLRRALHDSATGLPGRELFLDEVRRALSRRRADQKVRAVILVDVGGAHANRRSHAGAPPASVLVELASALKEAVRENDTVARIGATAFGLLVAVPSVDLAGTVFKRVAAIAKRRPSCHGGAIMPTASVELATTSGCDDDDFMLGLELAMESAALLARDHHECPGCGLGNGPAAPVGRHSGRCGIEKRFTDG